jgi:MFS family permease
MSHSVPRRYVPYLSFAAFGSFWGTWGASLPIVRDQASLSATELGVALLFVGAGALPAMSFTGRLIDRFGSRVSVLLLAILALSGLGLTAAATDFGTLIIAITIVGAASGATDVAINAVAAEVENASDRPVLARSHGLFSAAVVVSSLLGGLALSLRPSSTALFTAFGLCSAVILGSCALARTGTVFARSDHRYTEGGGTSRPRTWSVLLPLVVVGLVGALAYATENAFQSWGAVFLADEFTATAQVSSYAPAAFAAIAAVARLSLATLSRSHPAFLLVAGGAAAAVGSTILALSSSIGMALVGIVLAAAGTAVLFPTLLSGAVRGLDGSQRGAATSAVAATAYIGFLLGPAVMGLWAGATDLRTAFLAVAAGALVFAATAAPISRWARTIARRHA